MSLLELRKRLLQSPAVDYCVEPAKARQILESEHEYGQGDCLYIFSYEFNQNLCIHVNNGDEETFGRFTNNDNPAYMHLLLEGSYYLPYYTQETKSREEGIIGDLQSTRYDQAMSGIRDSSDTEDDGNRNPAFRSKTMDRYLVAGVRPPNLGTYIPPNPEHVQPFVAVRVLDEHPFSCKENLLFMLTSDGFHETDTLAALIERKYIKEEEITCMPRDVGEVLLVNSKGIKLIGTVIKVHIDSSPLRPDIKQCIKTLKALVVNNEIKTLGIMRDPAMLTTEDWSYFIEQVNKAFQGVEISIVFFKDNLPIPRIEDRYRLIKEYHESTIGGHKGTTKTYARLARDYYWRNIKADVRQFVRGCPECQVQKLVRVKTRLPMIITQTPSKPFKVMSMDFVGPKKDKNTENQWILTMQCNFSKYCIMVPTKDATAKDVARAITDRMICYFGPPEVLITDQGTNFMSELMEEFARIFKIDKFSTTAYHPQSNGSIERMHHTLHEFTKMFQDRCNTWDALLPLAQHAYNTAKHEGLNYSPHEVVFAEKARTPSSFPPREHLLTYDEYLADLTTALAQIRTMAAMNLTQAKYRSKGYYDRRHKARHFRVGEMVYVLKKPMKGKMDRQYIGPCEILEINHDTHNVKIKKGKDERIIHIDLIKHGYELPKSIPTMIDDGNSK